MVAQPEPLALHPKLGLTPQDLPHIPVFSVQRDENFALKAVAILLVIWGPRGLHPHLLRPIHHFHEFFLGVLEALVEEGAGFPHQVPDHVVVEETVAEVVSGRQDTPAHPGHPSAGLGALTIYPWPG